MCFKKGQRLITSRAYIRLYTNSTIIILCDKKNDRELIIEVVNKGGDITFIITNITNDTKEVLENPLTGTYNFKIAKENKYRFNIKSHAAIGSYKIYIKKI